MQITKADVTPVELHLNQPVRMAGYPEINQVNYDLGMALWD